MDDFRVLLIVSEFNSLITDRLCKGARDCLLERGVKDEHLSEVKVPGAFEIPLAAKWAVTKGGYDGMVALGCVITGETKHDEYVSLHAIRGIGQVSLDSGIPITLGVLTTLNKEQALARSGDKKGNKGYEVASSLMDLLTLRKKWV